MDTKKQHIIVVFWIYELAFPISIVLAFEQTAFFYLSFWFLFGFGVFFIGLFHCCTIVRRSLVVSCLVFLFSFFWECFSFVLFFFS